MKPQRAAVYLLVNERGEYATAIINKKMYRLEELSDEEMAETYNGGDSLPINQTYKPTTP